MIDDLDDVAGFGGISFEQASQAAISALQGRVRRRYISKNLLCGRTPSLGKEFFNSLSIGWSQKSTHWR